MLVTAGRARLRLALGYCVRRGEKALRIFAPCPPSKAKLRAWREAGADPAKTKAIVVEVAHSPNRCVKTHPERPHDPDRRTRPRR